MNDELHEALKNLKTANKLIRDKLIPNEEGLYNVYTIDRWIDIHNENVDALKLLIEQQKLHANKENELHEIRHHLITHIPIDQQQAVSASILETRNFAHLDFKNTQKTRRLFKYIVTRLRSVNKVVNQIKTNLENYKQD